MKPTLKLKKNSTDNWETLCRGLINRQASNNFPDLNNLNPVVNNNDLLFSNLATHFGIN